MKEKCLHLAMEQTVNLETEREFFRPTRLNQSTHSQTKSRSRRAARVTVLSYQVSIAFATYLSRVVYLINVACSEWKAIHIWRWTTRKTRTG